MVLKHLSVTEFHFETEFLKQSTNKEKLSKSIGSNCDRGPVFKLSFLPVNKVLLFKSTARLKSVDEGGAAECSIEFEKCSNFWFVESSSSLNFLVNGEFLEFFFVTNFVDCTADCTVLY